MGAVTTATSQSTHTTPSEYKEIEEHTNNDQRNYSLHVFILLTPKFVPLLKTLRKVLHTEKHAFTRIP